MLAPQSAADAWDESHRAPQDLVVLDSGGRAVRRIGSGSAAKSWVWDCLDMHGRKVPAGVYYVSACGSAGSGSVRVVLVR